jgi:hypothetical protein
MAWGLGLALALAGCQAVSVLRPEGSLRMYNRTATEDKLGIKVFSATGGGWTVLAGGRGCQAVSVPLTVSIGAADKNGAVGEYTQLVSSADVANPADAEIWIDVAQDGTVTWGEGCPTGPLKLPPRNAGPPGQSPEGAGGRSG